MERRMDNVESELKDHDKRLDALEAFKTEVLLGIKLLKYFITPGVAFLILAQVLKWMAII